MSKITVYDNKEGETFYRESDTYGHTDRYDVERTTKAELDAWLRKHGFYIVGLETS